MKRFLFLGIALALCSSVVYPSPTEAKDVGTPVFSVKEKQVYQAPVVVELTVYKVCDLAATDFILIAPTQAAPVVAVVPAKISVPVVATLAKGGPPRGSPRTYATLYSNRFSKSRCHVNRFYHIDPGLRGC